MMNEARNDLETSFEDGRFLLMEFYFKKSKQRNYHCCRRNEPWVVGRCTFACFYGGGYKRAVWSVPPQKHTTEKHSFGVYLPLNVPRKWGLTCIIMTKSQTMIKEARNDLETSLEDGRFLFIESHFKKSRLTAITETTAVVVVMNQKAMIRSLPLRQKYRKSLTQQRYLLCWWERTRSRTRNLRKRGDLKRVESQWNDDITSGNPVSRLRSQMVIHRSLKCLFVSNSAFHQIPF